MTIRNSTSVEGKTSPEEQRLIDEQRALYRENMKLTTMLTMARAMVGMWINGYNALLHHSVNMKDLPEYRDDADLDKALEIGGEAGGTRVVDYCKRVINGTNAAVRRKGLRPV